MGTENDLQAMVLFIQDPKFVEKNKRLGRAARGTMLVSKHEVYSIAGDLHSSGFDTHVQLTGKVKDLKRSKDLAFFVILHCDGLMLCNLCSTEGNPKLVVWNPCTGQRKKIKPRTRYSFDDTYALGYTRSSSCGHSYKILRYCYYQNDQKVWATECEIYELSSDSWRVINSFNREYDLYFSGMSLKGDTYWVAGDEREETVSFLMKFDFTAERFVRLPPLPSQILDTECTAALSVVRDEKLSVLHIDGRSNVMRIWVSNKIDNEESKDFSWRSDAFLTVDFDKFNIPSVESFFLDEENKVAVCSGKYTYDRDWASIYIVGEDMHEQVYEDTMNAFHLDWPVVVTYLPSLVLI